MLNVIQEASFFLFVTILFLGCSVSSKSVKVSYDKTVGKTTYETKEMRLDGIDLSSGLQQAENRYYVQVTARCTGKDCVPSEYTLDFIKEGPQSVRIGGRDVTLEVGTETMRWEDPQSRDVSQTTTIRSGTFASVEVSSKQLSTIGSTSSVQGTVGGESFSIRHRNRAPIRDLLLKVEKTGGDASGEESAEKPSSEDMR